MGPKIRHAGAFITFEGMDGAGKTSTSEQVANQLTALGYEIEFINKKGVELREPYLAQHADSIKALIWGYPASAPIGELGDGHWLHLMASWFYLVDQMAVRPALSRGRIVVIDNWIAKFLARFLIKPSDRAQQARLAFAGLSIPDLTLFLDVDPAVAAGRKKEFTIAECGNLDGHSGITSREFISYQTRVRGALNSLSTEWNWQPIDTTSQTQEVVIATAIASIEQYLNSILVEFDELCTYKKS